jgi:Flp pilus assembly protein CpaB
MKRRSWLWFIAALVLAGLAGVIAIFALRQAADRGTPEAATPGRVVVVARQPIAVNSTVRVDNVVSDERSSVPSGAAVQIQDVLGRITLRDIAQGEVILMQDLTSEISGTHNLPFLLGDDKIAVALPANDILGKWGAVAPGDHVDVLFTLDVLLETPLPFEIRDMAEEGINFQSVERDQSLDKVSVLSLQNLEVLQVIDEPVPSEQQQEQASLAPRALILKIDPQDAMVLKYLVDSAGKIDLALRSPTNNTLFDVEPVNINYLMLRYGIRLPEPLEQGR